MTRRSIVSLVSVVSLVFVLAAGCDGLMATPAPVIITFAHPEDESGAYEQWAQQFHDRYPHITVELSTDMAAEGKDAFVATQFELAQYLASSAVLDLSPLIEQSEELDMADFYPAISRVFKSRGRQWALPFGLDMMMTFFNKDLFDRYGVSYPEIGWTWSDFLDRAQALTRRSDNTYGFALQYSDDFGLFEPLMMIYQHGGRIFDSLDTPTRATFDEPLNIEAMNFYASLTQVYHVAPSSEEAQRFGRAYPWSGIFDGRFAMWSMMYSQRGGVQWPTPWRMNWGMVPMPRDVTGGTLTIANGLYISSDTEHPMEAWQWITYLSTQSPPSAMPARISLAESQRFGQTVGFEIAEAARASVADAIMVNPELLGFEKELGAFTEALGQIRSGEVTPDIALTAAQRKADS
jgi:multiple sugar transport system substrate-binding protein